MNAGAVVGCGVVVVAAAAAAAAAVVVVVVAAAATAVVVWGAVPQDRPTNRSLTAD